MMGSDVAGKRRSRVSLLTLVLLLTIAAMAVALWRMGQEVVPLRNELRALRAETGHVTVDDPTRLYAVRALTTEDNVARWRLYVPPGKQFFLHFEPWDVPKTGVPQSPRQRSGMPLVGEGEFVFEFRLEEESASPPRLIARLSGRNQTQVYGDKLELKERQERWIKNEVTGGRTEKWGGVMHEQVSAAAEEPLVLLRLRAQRVVVSSRNAAGEPTGWYFEDHPDPTDGVIIWVDQHER